MWPIAAQLKFVYLMIRDRLVVSLLNIDFELITYAEGVSLRCFDKYCRGAEKRQLFSLLSYWGAQKPNTSQLNDFIISCIFFCMTYGGVRILRVKTLCGVRGGAKQSCVILLNKWTFVPTFSLPSPPLPLFFTHLLSVFAIYVYFLNFS